MQTKYRLRPASLCIPTSSIVVITRDHRTAQTRSTNPAPSVTPLTIRHFLQEYHRIFPSLSAPLDAIAMELEPDNLVYDIRGHVRRRE